VAPDVQRLAADFLSEDPLRIQIGGVALTANPSVTQRVIVCPEADKLTRLKALLANLEGKALVFAATRHSCKRLATDLAPAEYPVYCIHSDMAQAEREQTMRRFRQPEESLLVATDVAARGLDVCDIRTVVNYDFPATIADYIHRIGRTGRAGATGDSYSFITPQDGRKARDLIRVMEEAGQPVPHDLRSLHHQHVQRSEHTGGSQRPPPSKAPRPSDKTSERTGRRR
jgi:ATP-dependent RNA helicase DDX5/DBP2